MRDGCRAAIDALIADDDLAEGWTRKDGIGASWTMPLVPNREALTIDCGWSTKKKIRRMQAIAERTFVGRGGSDV